MLEPSADEIRTWSNSVLQLISDYFGKLRDRPVYRYTSSREIRDGLDRALPTKGTDFDALLNVFCERIIPFSRQNAHPRMFGYVQSPGTPIGSGKFLGSNLKPAGSSSAVDRWPISSGSQ